MEDSVKMNYRKILLSILLLIVFTPAAFGSTEVMIQSSGDTSCETDDVECSTVTFENIKGRRSYTTNNWSIQHQHYQEICSITVEMCVDDCGAITITIEEEPECLPYPLPSPW